MTGLERPTTMRGLVLDARAPSGVRMRDDLALPSPRRGEVRVRVAYASVTGHEFDLARSRLVRLARCLRRAPGDVETGLEFAGIVDTDGAAFTRGQPVFGYVDMVAGSKPHGEFLTIPEAYLARAPSGLSLERAASLPMGAQTALVALRDVAKIRPGQRVLILGASGGVGVMAVQVAVILGARVTAVAGARHHVRLAELGAERTEDYRVTPLDRMSGRYDAVIDLSSTAYLSQVRHLLADRGVFIPADPLRNIVDVTLSRRARWLMVDRGDGAKLREIAGWVEQGRLHPVVDAVFELDDWPAAVARGHERGRLGRTMLHLA